MIVPPGRVRTGVGNVRLGHDNKPHTRKSGLGVRYVGMFMCAHYCEISLFVGIHKICGWG